MQKKNIVTVSSFTLACIVLNLAGKWLAAAWELPVLLDSFGTALAAYSLGPVCGAIIGVTVNIISGFGEPVRMVYALTGAGLGIVIGLCARKRMLEDLFGILSVGFLVTLVDVIISTPLNWLFFNGYTGNKWCDGVIELLQSWGVLPVFCYAAGEFYLDFIDNLAVLLVLAGAVWLVRQMRQKRGLRGAACLLVLAALCGVLPRQAGALTHSAAMGYTAYLQTVYNAENGLPGGTANDIAQTDDGVLWIGTYGGLYRYNGNEFRWMKEFSSIKNVNCFYVDAEGRLWIGTNDSGLSICINNTITNVLNEDSGLPANSVRCITMDTNGYYYIGTTGALAVADLTDGLRVMAEIPEITYAWSIAADHRGTVAVVTDSGELYIVREGEIQLKADPLSSGDRYTCCTFDAEGRLYVGTSGSRFIVYRIDRGRMEQEKSYTCNGISYLNELTFSAGGDLLVCAYNGMGYVDWSGIFQLIPAKRFSSSVGHALFDYQGNLWFTSSRLGLLKMTRSPFTEVYGKAGLEEKVVNAVTGWQDRFFFGTDTGIEIVNRQLSSAEHRSWQNRLEGVRVRSLYVDSRDCLWISTSGRGTWRVTADDQVTVYDTAKGLPDNWMRSALELRDGEMALAGDSGITLLKDGKVTCTVGPESGLENPKVLTMLEWHEDCLLAGTDGNGIAVIQNGRVVRELKEKDGLSSKIILRLIKDPEEDGVFIVTSNSLCYMDAHERIRELTNFPYYNNYDIPAYRGGELFVTSSAGLYAVNRKALLSGANVEYTLLDLKKGLRAALTANSWNYMDPEGGLYLAGDNGVTVVDLDRYDVSYRSYRMNLRAMTVDDIPFTQRLGETVTIPRGAKRIVLSPEVVNYSISDPRVAVWLEGFDSGPKVMAMSELSDAVYTNLPSGRYRFHIAILNDNGETVAENIYSFEKEEEFHDGALFRFYAVFVFVLIIAYLTWLLFRTQIQRTMNIQKRELDLARKQVEMSNEAILTIARTVDAKDAYTSQHSARVAEYSVMIARRLGMSEAEQEELHRTALLHDIGKIGIPDGILNKPGRLTDEEYDRMKTHVVEGARILKDFTLVDHVVEGAQYHHERYDGKGYVYGLKGEQIPLYARIIGIADAFDAMTAHRVYRKRLEPDFVLGEIRRGRGTQFDPVMVDALLGLIEDGSIQMDQLYDNQATEGGTGE